MINPTYLVPIKKGRPVPYKYRLKRFPDSEWESYLYEVLNDLSSRFPWQSDAIALQGIDWIKKRRMF